MRYVTRIYRRDYLLVRVLPKITEYDLTDQILEQTTLKTGVSGQIHLCFARNEAAQTKLRIKTQAPPLRVIRAFEHEEGVALVHLHNVSGGILGGDQFDMQFDLDANAHAVITTTGSNRIYRHRDGYKTSNQALRVNLAAGSVLEYIPDSTIPFARSRFAQQTQITMQAGSMLFWNDLLNPGREAFDERFDWSHFGSETHIVADNRPILIERWQLNPAEQPIASLAYMGDWTHSATFTACHCGITSAALHALEAELTRLAQQLSDGDASWGVSRLVADGVVVRGVSRIGRKLPNQLEQFHNCARQLLIGKPLIRPRKIY